MSYATRYMMVVQYLGGHFKGSAGQGAAHISTVQDCLEDVASTIMNRGKHCPVTLAGRTDAGVHATGQVAHIDLARSRPDLPAMSSLQVQRAFNSNLNRRGLLPFLQVSHVRRVSVDFHARHSATMRHYCYRVLHGLGASQAFLPESGRVWQVPERLNVQQMQEAAALLEAHCQTPRDLSSIRRARCEAASPVRTMSAVKVRDAGIQPWHSGFFGLSSSLSSSDHDNPQGLTHGVSTVPCGSFSNVAIDLTSSPSLLTCSLSSKSFLYSQVRIVMGMLVDVGLGKLTPSDMPIIIDRCSRELNPSPTAPPEGLFLTDICYPDQLFL